MNHLDQKTRETEAGLAVAISSSKLAVGSTYPILGAITKVFLNESGEFIAVINDNVFAKISLSEEKEIQLLKQKAFETGIFICTVLAIGQQLEVECQAAIFGQTKAGHA